MFRVFSDSCLSLEDMDTVLCPNLQERPHVLGPGTDFFTEDGEPVRPQPGMETLQKVFSGSALDLNAMNSGDEEPTSPLGQSSSPTGRNIPVSTILNQLTTETEREKLRTAKSKIIVLVIGDATYISSHMVSKLLDIGYTVRLTLSDTSKPQIMEMFYNRETANRLSIIQVDMTNSGALRDVIRGCRYVIHCGCPNSAFSNKEKGQTKGGPGKSALSYHTEAVQALFDGVQLSGKSTVKRVILTGAATSVTSDTVPESGSYDETCWSTAAQTDKDSVPYAKLVFEKEARRISLMLGVELIVLLPSVMLGPSRTEEMGEANTLLQTLAKGSRLFPFCPDLYWNFVDVNDVAEAFVRSLETPLTEVKDRRIIISGECLGLPQLCSIIKLKYPHLHPPTYKASRLFTLLLSGVLSSSVNIKFLWRSLGVKKVLDNSCARQSLQMRFTPIEDTVVACIDRMIRAEALPPPPPAAVVEAERKRNKIVAIVSVTVGVVAVVTLVAKRVSQK
ncbi:dihydroflavonol-4-reductase [Angomonas deanei]|uniref:NAD dependent epimerase/dehydratase family, putative n=1 Tax=Angomonas deanei TaxID=59799 RepID=A0A7G2C578_9TRYP|nr:dihydroflavonol-4-reductase [Angomonas deanei]CAD2214886.1 NAD dependent epimerase/dehydratase family, putative [Angomonas deanei]|eukprot:EPY43900.1 dihydroflavonol-4-reductase [Angomonas deanei]